MTGALTLRLKDVPWDQALQIIMEAKGLGMRKSGTVLWIAPRTRSTSAPRRTTRPPRPAAARTPAHPGLPAQLRQGVGHRPRLTATSGGSGGGGGATSAAGTSPTASTPGARFLSPRGSAIDEPRTNQIFVTDTAAKLEEVRLLLQTLDVPVRQVMIEARIVEARDTFGRSLGVRLGGGDLRAQRGGDGGYSIGGATACNWHRLRQRDWLHWLPVRAGMNISGVKPGGRRGKVPAPLALS
ncbi:secretin N-terminal domain-containing protein [Melaminivora jejuensis]|uniref:secretin N-terminal domain-containing protein n=1 Tax=Melaminivora jejuensis TaxID=1267217 RepID=UPI00398A9C9F